MNAKREVSKADGREKCDDYIKDLKKYMGKLQNNFDMMKIDNVEAKAEIEAEVNIIIQVVNQSIVKLENLKTKFK